jgi:hypothetical protein
LLLIEESQKVYATTTTTTSSSLNENKFGRIFKFFKSAKKPTSSLSNVIEEKKASTSIAEEMKMEFSSSGCDERGSTSLSESLDTYSAASSPKEVIAKGKRQQNLSVVESTSFQDTTVNNKTDEENDDDDEINETSILNKNSCKKFNTLRENKVQSSENFKLETLDLFKYNTASRVVDATRGAKATILKPKKLFSSSINSVGQNAVNTMSSFKANVTPRINDNRKNTNNNNNNNNDSINLPEDCSQGNF